MTKITRTTFKKFIRGNDGKLFINVRSKFDGMTDCVESCNGGFTPVEPSTRDAEYSLGIAGLWLVGSSRDYFTAYEDANFKGIEVYNCCGTQVLAVRKGE